MKLHVSRPAIAHLPKEVKEYIIHLEMLLQDTEKNLKKVKQLGIAVCIYSGHPVFHSSSDKECEENAALLSSFFK